MYIYICLGASVCHLFCNVCTFSAKVHTLHSKNQLDCAYTDSPPYFPKVTNVFLLCAYSSYVCVCF